MYTPLQIRPSSSSSPNEFTLVLSLGAGVFAGEKPPSCPREWRHGAQAGQAGWRQRTKILWKHFSIFSNSASRHFGVYCKNDDGTKCRHLFLWFNSPAKSVLGAQWKTALAIVLADPKFAPSCVLGEVRKSPKWRLHAGPEHHLHARKNLFATGCDFCFSWPHDHRSL